MQAMSKVISLIVVGTDGLESRHSKALMFLYLLMSKVSGITRKYHLHLILKLD